MQQILKWLGLLWLMGGINHCIYSSPVSEALEKIPSEERQVLEDFFQKLMMHSRFAYTLMGDKPLSFEGFWIKTPAIATNYSPLFQIQQIWDKPKQDKHWLVWKKYEHLFPSEKFLFFDQLFICSKAPLTSGCCQLFVLVNKEAFTEKVNAHLDLFKSILGKDISSDYLLKQLEENRLFFKVFKENDILIGILLGYGKHNSLLYWQREQALLSLSPLALEGTLQPFKNDLAFPFLLRIPPFMADLSHPETVALKQKYERQRREISKRFAEGNFLEKTLTQLTQ